MSGVSFSTQILSSIKQAEFDQLFDQIAEDKEKIKKDYGSFFCDNIGVDTLYSIPEVQPEELDIETGNYPDCLKPSDLKGNSAIRGMSKEKRPWVAFQVNILNPETNEVIDKVVEMIFKRYPNDADGKPGSIFEHHYVSVFNLKTEDGLRGVTTSFNCLGNQAQLQA